MCTNPDNAYKLNRLFSYHIPTISGNNSAKKVSLKSPRVGEAETKECRTFFLHGRPWILPWTKSISYELDITFTSSRHNCLVIVTSSAIDVTSSTECKTSKEDTVSDLNCMDWVVWIRTNGLSYYRYSTNCVFSSRMYKNTHCNSILSTLVHTSDA